MDKPPDAASSSWLLPPTFLIGRDSRGNWVAQERSGACGGLFASRAAALKFAKFESGNQPHAVVWVNGVLELDYRVCRTARQPNQNANDFRLRSMRGNIGVSP
jgi:hypothetical protein